MVSGKVSMDKYSGGLIMASPDIVAPLADLKKVRARGGGGQSGGPCIFSLVHDGFGMDFGLCHISPIP